MAVLRHASTAWAVPGAASLARSACLSLIPCVVLVGHGFTQRTWKGTRRLGRTAYHHAYLLYCLLIQTNISRNILHLSLLINQQLYALYSVGMFLNTNMCF